ncbi:signal-transducing adaptor protein 2 isoform X1 [Salmo trutta]|uniref:Signal transducing adaptor family member 2b n=2 Tax=Salmo trutta TaxID=8032 RepID=A0A673W6E0_SALTR|nr:signal-transducing adaptor protein 2-like isoform X1 [Salmo trutta]
MATSKRARRRSNHLTHCYYEGYLEKRLFNDTASRRLWTCLCGNTLFFFNNTKDNDYVEKLDLSDVMSLTDDCSGDRKLEAAGLLLHMKDGEIQITAPSLEARELWKGFIYCVVELSVPSSLNLLPGQIHMMRETVETERERRNNLSLTLAAASSSNLSLVEDMPACYQPVSRTEAEIMLERHSDRGNLLLRPSRDGVSLAVTTRQDLSGSVFRHYRVARKHDGGYTFDVETPIPCATLHGVINCLVEKTNGALTPFIMEGPYEESITFVQANEESGERSLQCAPSTPMPPVPVPALPPKPGPRERVPTPGSESDRGDDTQKEKEEGSAVQAVQPPPTPFRLPKAERKTPLMPPVPTPRTSPSTSTDTPDARLRRLAVNSVPLDIVAQTISEELKLKLKRLAHQQ